jgi:phenylpyruvate tautomerase PptA (4-oxalocrotonate tautomerase family)
MYPGRTPEMKRALTDCFIELIHQHTGVPAADIQCAITEIPPENYFGGTSHPYIKSLKKE